MSIGNNVLLSLNMLLIVLGLSILVVTIGFNAIRQLRHHTRAGIVSVTLVLAACGLIAAGVIRITFPMLTGSPTPADPVRGEPLAILVASVGAVVTTLTGLILFWIERRRDGFDPSASPGLLFTGAGIFVLVAALVIPNLPGQFTVARANARQAANVRGGPLPPRAVRQTSTPTITPTPSATPTEAPTLTAIPSESPTALFTAIAYGYGETRASTGCTVTAQTMIFLRGDPSLKQQAIGKIFAGTLLVVTGQTPDKAWWRVVNRNGDVAVEGWVSADFVSPGLSCAADAVPVVGPTETPTPTPRQGRALSQTPRPSPTSLPVVSECTLMTRISVSLRAGPSTANPIITQVPDRTALTATGRTADSAWWRVSYSVDGALREGWVGGAAVLAASNCAGLPSVTPTG